ncbi:MAG: PAS domain-containing protein [Candidatus Hydrogenedentes bacterium]|nr:PAS domain-containing protein [Candidatus Hydrogenedentota bacterium]
MKSKPVQAKEATAPAKPAKRKVQAKRPKGENKAAKPSPKPKAAPPDVEVPELSFPVICLGASAGGLEALQSFFTTVEPRRNYAYVIVTHLEPSKPSHLPELITRHVALPVLQVRDKMPLEPKHVYVIPPQADILVAKGRFHFQERSRDSSPGPINVFLRSLAVAAKENAVAVIHSGLGSDGSNGAQTIKEQFGLVIAQEPSTARFPSMSNSVIASGLADLVLPPEKMPRHIREYLSKVRGKAASAEKPADQATLEALRKVLFLLRKHTGHDFSNYKTSTLLRRIKRRMGIHQLSEYPAYLRYLEEHQQELNTLFGELLIGVTNFFRDPEAWKFIAERILPELLDQKPDGYELRIWIPGVSTGEEAYSMAIIMQEYMESRHKNLHVQIFATDINLEAVESARLGVFPAHISDDVDPERLKRFFVQENSHFRVKREVREMVIFALQNLIKDPPFTRIDFICCRNLLIYLDTQLQRKVLPLLHFSLRPGGILFLGTSESVSEFADLFQTLDVKWKLYRRREAATNQPMLEFALRPQEITNQAAEPRVVTPSLIQLAEKCLLKHFAPTSVLVSPHGEIIYIHGRTGKYLEPSAGHARLNVLEMAREGLASKLPGLIRSCTSQRKRIAYEGLRVKTNGDFAEVNVVLEPLIHEHPLLEGLVLVSFHDQHSAVTKDKRAKARGRQTVHYVEELERDLANTRDNLQTMVEELETSNEELRSVNEEYQSTNEELQSANEELETSREEMQSLNEELATVNEELQEKVEGLTVLHEEMKLFLDSLDMPTIFLDKDLRIRRFTSQAKRVINIMDQDVGRPLNHLATELKQTKLVDDCALVNETRKPLQKEVQSQDGHWHLMRILPYKKKDSGMDGVVINFIDLEQLKGERDERILAAHDKMDKQGDKG